MTSSVQSPPRVLHELDNGLLTIQLNHSHRLNVLDDELVVELDELWAATRDDYRVRAVVLTGTGTEAFCIGTRHGSRAACPSTAHSPRIDTHVPLVVAVNGLVRREGFRMLAGATAILCAPHVQFVDPPPGSPFEGVYEAAAAYAAGLITEIIPLPQLRARAESTARSLADGYGFDREIAL